MSDDEIEHEVPLKWPDDLGVAGYSNNVVVQTDPSGMVFLTFSQTSPPIILGPPESVRAILERVEFVEAKTVARVVMTREDFLAALQILATHAKRKDDAGDTPKSASA